MFANPTNRLAAVAVVVVVVLAGVMVYSCTSDNKPKKEESKRLTEPAQPVPVAAAPAPVEEELPVEAYLTAAMQYFDKATKVCYDDSDGAYYFKYPFTQKVDGDQIPSYYEGWNMESKLEFKKLGNNTIAVVNWDVMTSITADLTGLKCMDRASIGRSWNTQ